MTKPRRSSAVVTGAAAIFAFTVMGGAALAQAPNPTNQPPATGTPPPAAQPKTGSAAGKTGTTSGTGSGTTSGTGSGTTSGTGSGSAADTTGPAPADVLTKLHHSNKMEIEAGKLAQEKGQSKGVKDFGRMLVRDHTAADKKLVTVAKQLKVELPTAAPEMKHEKLEKARALTGAEFDKAFTEAMVEDHKTDVEEATEARDKTNVPQLKKLLVEMVPKLEKHRATAEKLNSAAENTGTGSEAGKK